MDLGNKTTSEFRTDFDSPLGVPNSEVSLYNFIQPIIKYHDVMGFICSLIFVAVITIYNTIATEVIRSH